MLTFSSGITLPAKTSTTQRSFPSTHLFVQFVLTLFCRAGWGDDGSIPGPPRHLRHTVEGGGHHWEDDEEEEEDQEYRYAGGNGVPAHLEEDDEDEDEEDEGMYVHRPMAQHHRARYVESESDEEEDDGENDPYAGPYGW